MLQLGSLNSSISSVSIVTQILEETFEQERCSINVIVYRGVSKSSSESTAQRITDDIFFWRNFDNWHLVARRKLIHMDKSST